MRMLAALTLSLGLACTRVPPSVVDATPLQIANTESTAVHAFRWAALPDAYIVSFPTSGQAAQAFDRVSLFAEHPIFYGRIATRQDLDTYFAATNAVQEEGAWIYAGGFDIDAKDAALFFNEAPELFPEELALRNLLLKEGIMWKEGNVYLAERKAILGVSRDLYSSLERQVLEHELRHALYFLDQDYAKATRVLWTGLSETERAEVRKKLGGLYVSSDEDLMMNEFQAYLSETDPFIVHQWLGTSIDKKRATQLRSEFFEATKHISAAQSISPRPYRRAVDSSAIE